MNGIPLGRVAPEDIAATVFLSSDAAMTGRRLPADGANLALNAGGAVAWRRHRHSRGEGGEAQ